MRLVNILGIPVLAFFFFGFTFSQEGDATITGTIEPAEAFPIVWVIQNDEAIAQVEAERNGDFTIEIPAGTYDLYIEPTMEGYQIAYVENITINAGEEHDLGVIEIPAVELP